MRDSRSVLTGYALAATSVAAATAVRHLLDPWLGDQAPFITYITAVAVTALYAGWGPSWLAVVLGSLCADYWFLSPRGTFALSGPSNQIGIILYAVTSALIVVLGRSLQESQKQLRRHVASLQDSSQRLDADLQMFKHLVDHTRDAIYIADPRAGFRFAYANKACCALLGYPLDEVLRMAIPDFVPDFPLERCEGFWQTVKTRGALSFETRFRRGDGKIMPAEVTASTLEFQEKEYVVGTAHDITERKRLEEEDQRLHRLLDSIVENLPGMLFVKDAKTRRFILFNKAGLDLIGYSREDVIGKSDYDLFPKEQADFFTAKDRDTLAGRILVDIPEEAFLSKAHGQRILHTRKVPLFDAGGEPAYLLGVSEDITERKRATATLQESVIRAQRQGTALIGLTKPPPLQSEEDLARSLQRITETAAKTLDVERVSIWQYNEDRTTIHCKDLYESSLGRHSEGGELRAADHPAYFEALAQSDLIDAGDALLDPRTSQFSEGYLKPLGIGAMLDAPIRFHGGTDGVLCHEHVGPARQWTQDEKTFVLALANLVSLELEEQARREGAEILRQSEEWFRSLIEKSTDIISVLDAGGVIRYASPSAYQLLAYSAEDLLGKPVFDFLHPEDLSTGRTVMAQALAAPDVPHTIELRFRSGIGEWCVMEATGRSIKDAHGRRSVILNARDVTERKQNQQKLEEQLRLKAFAAEVGTAMTGAQSLSDGLKACTEAMVQHFGAAFGRIWTLDPLENVLKLQASSGLYTHLEGAHCRIPVGQYKIGLIAQTKQPTLTNQVIGDPRIHDQEWAVREGMVAFAGYPLLVAGRVVGVMAMFARQPLSEETLQSLQVVAQAVAQFVERKRTEGELFASHEMLQKVVSTIPQHVFWKDRDCRYLGCNRLFAESAGLGKPADIVGKSDFDLAWKASAEEYRTDDCAVMDSGLPKLNYEESQTRSDDSVLWLRTSKLPLVDQAGAVIGVLGIYDDITERKRAEEALRASEERFRTIFDQAPLGIALIDSFTGHIHAVNARFAQIAGRSVAEMTRINWMSITHPDDVQEDLDNMALMNAGKTSGFHMEKRYLRPSGEAVWISMTIAPVRTDDRLQRRHLCMIEDITERKHIDEALRDAEAKFRILVEQPLLGFYIIGGGGFLYANAKLADIFGYSTDELLSLPPLQLIAEQERERIAANIRRRLQGESFSPSYGFKGRRKDGTLIDVEVYAARADLHGEAAIIGILRDVTELNRLQTESRRLERMAAWGQLLGGIAHELKNPLFILSGHLQLFKERLQSYADRGVMADFTKIEDAAKRIFMITEHFLHLARPATSKRQLCAVQTLLENSMDALSHELSEHQVSLALMLSDSLPKVWTDPSLLREVFHHLIVNAIEAMAQAPDKRKLTVGADRIEDGIEVRIQDTGPGIPLDRQTRIFEPFFTTKPPDQATGLGLWIVRSNLMVLQGSVRVESKPGQGATFIVRLPLLPQPADA